MRARNIKPGIFKNEILGKQDPIYTLLFEGLWCLADRLGILEDRPERIRAELFPYRDSSLEVHRYLTELERWGFILRYRFAENRLIFVLEFEKHQSPHHTEKKSIFKPPTEEMIRQHLLTVNSRLSNGGYPPDSLIHPFSDSTPPNPLKGEAAPSAPLLPKPKRRNLASLDIIKKDSDRQAFQSLWEDWPKRSDGKPSRGSRPKAELCFQKILEAGEVKAFELLEASAVYREEWSQVKEGWVQNVSTFLALEAGLWKQCVKVIRARSMEAM